MSGEEEKISKWSVFKQTTSKLWQTAKKNPVASIITVASLAFPPFGTVVGAGIIGMAIGKKTHKEQNPSDKDPQAKLGFWAGIKRTATKIWNTVKENPGKTALVLVASLFAPIGTAIAAATIAKVAADKTYEVQGEHRAEIGVKNIKVDKSVPLGKSQEIEQEPSRGAGFATKLKEERAHSKGRVGGIR